MNATLNIEGIRLENIRIDNLKEQELEEKQISLSVLRLDLIHPLLSGNKWFKLKYHLREAEIQGARTLLTFGGPYSNHLLATAAAGNMVGFRTIAMVRGEVPAELNPTLTQSRRLGMCLHFITRSHYALKENAPGVRDLIDENKPCYLIPEGGYDELGVRGCREILSPCDWGHPEECGDFRQYTHIVCAAGTGATLAGLLNQAETHQRVTGVAVLKQGAQLLEPLKKYLGLERKMRQLDILTEYHFGGYGKYTPGLLDFINEFYLLHHLPLDFVYTGKLMYAIVDQARKGSFPEGSHILAIHTGGLQGNRSLPDKSLVF